MKEGLKAVWERWKRFARWLMERQATLVFGLLYVGVLGPFAIALRVLSDPLRYRARARSTFWVERHPVTPSLEEGRRQ